MMCVPINNSTTGVTSVEGTAIPSRAPLFILGV